MATPVTPASATLRDGPARRVSSPLTEPGRCERDAIRNPGDAHFPEVLLADDLAVLLVIEDGRRAQRSWNPHRDGQQTRHARGLLDLETCLPILMSGKTGRTLASGKLFASVALTSSVFASHTEPAGLVLSAGFEPASSSQYAFPLMTTCTLSPLTPPTCGLYGLVNGAPAAVCANRSSP